MLLPSNLTSFTTASLPPSFALMAKRRVLRGDDLASGTLHLYLEDSTFVEYFNSFLLLPIFPNKIVYNEETRHFEQVLASSGSEEGETIGWSGDPSDVSSTSSKSTMFLTDDCIGATLDKEQCLQWVLGHRLPLFVKSDIYSEFKLCKALTQGDDGVMRDVRWLTGRGEGEMVRGRVRSQSVMDSLHTPGVDLHQLLSSKRGMYSFWRFLQDTAGEKNWLLWLDAERVKYCSSQQEQISMVRNLRQRYLTPGGPLELPVDTKFRLSLESGDGADILALQQMLADNLKYYWCPRFILHHCCVQESILKSHTRPHTSLGILPSMSTQACFMNHPRVQTPLSPLKTPTFCRITRQKSGISSRECLNSQPGTRPNTGRRSINPADLSLVGNRETEVGTEKGEGLSVGGMEGKSKGRRGMGTKSCLTILSSTLEVSRKSSIVFKRDTSRCSSVPMLPEADSKAGNRMRNGTVEPLQIESKNKTMPKLVPGLPQSLRQTYTPSPAPTLYQEECDLPSTSSSAYHKLTAYTAHHLPNPSTSTEQIVQPTSNREQPTMCHIISVSGIPLLPPSHPPCSPTSHMVHCLASEYRNAGGYFEEYLKSMTNRVPLHCLLFWREVQEYKSLFVSPSFNPSTVQTKAMALYGRFVVEACPSPLSLPPSLPSHLLPLLSPAYDDLFDEVEEHILHILLEQWELMQMLEETQFKKVERVCLSRGGSASRCRAPSAVSFTTLDELSEEWQAVAISCQTPQDTQYPSNIPSPHPRIKSSHSFSPLHTLTPSKPLISSTSQAPVTAVGLNDIINDPDELQHFKMFLNERKAAKHLMCWMEIEAFRGIPSRDPHLRDLKARQLRERYFTRRYLLGPNSPACREAQRQIVGAGGGKRRLPSRPKTAVFREAQKHVQAKLEKKWLAEFLQTPEYKARSGVAPERDEGEEGEGSTAKPRVTVNLDVKFSQSHEALLLRKALQKETSRELFLSFLSVCGASDTNSKADVEFWLEVQRFKEMCHAHTDKLILSEKLKAMKECYLNSSVPPKLHIDVPQSMANAILCKDVGPYVFREAQIKVFRHLYSYWQEYQMMSHNLSSPAEIPAEIEKMRTKMEQLRKETEQERALKHGEQQFQFETVAEREERMKREREEKEVAVNFSLVNPHPQYKH